MSAITTGTVTTLSKGGSSGNASFTHISDKASLLVAVGMTVLSGAVPANVTYNGDSLTKIAERTTDTGVKIQLWHIAAADAGSNTVLVDNTAFGICFIAAISVDAVDSFGTPVYDGGGAFFSSGAYTLNVPDMATDDLAFAASIIRDTADGNMTLSVSGTSLYAGVAPPGGSAGYHAGQTATGTGTVGLTFTPSEPAYYTALAIRLAAPAASARRRITALLGSRNLKAVVSRIVTRAWAGPPTVATTPGGGGGSGGVAGTVSPTRRGLFRGRSGRAGTGNA